MAKTLNARIITKHDKEENWRKATSFIPKLGEIVVYEADQNSYVSSVPRLKVGNGKDTINSLPFMTEIYVIKDGDKVLSDNNYSDRHYSIVDNIPNNPKYTDTLYYAGQNIGIQGTTFYNKGVVSISSDSQKGCLKIGTRNGPQAADISYTTVEIPGLSSAAFFETDALATAEQGLRADNSVQNVLNGVTNGTIRIEKYNSSTGMSEMSEVSVGGLGALAYLDDFSSLGGDIENVGNLITQVNEITNLLNAHIDNMLNPHEVQGNQIIGTIPASSLPVLDYLSLSGGTITGNLSISTAYRPALNLVADGQMRSKIFSNDDNSYRLTFAQYASDTSSYADCYILPDPTIGLSANQFYRIITERGGTITGALSISNTTASTSTTTGAVKISGGLGVAGSIYGNKVYGAVYNDYAEYRQSAEPIEPGYIVYSGDNGILHKTVARMQFFEGVVSDTFGFSIGQTEKAQTPLAVAGRVLVYTDEELHAGNVVCAGPGGKASKMTKQEIKDYPDRIVGVVSEIPTYETWGEANVPVNGRVWIRV